MCQYSLLKYFVFLYFTLELSFNSCYITIRKVVYDMKKESTATRLKHIMKERQLRQVDILEKCKPFCQRFNVKLGRNDLSQYVNGKVEPGQDKLTVLGMALNVSEAWLMGYDVPMERNGTKTVKIEELPQIMLYYNQLNDIGRHVATEQVKVLTEVPRYTNTQNASETESEVAEDFVPYFTDKEEALKYLRSQKFIAAFGENTKNLSDVNILLIANALYKNNHKE